VDVLSDYSLIMNPKAQKLYESFNIKSSGLRCGYYSRRKNVCAECKSDLTDVTTAECVMLVTTQETYLPRSCLPGSKDKQWKRGMRRTEACFGGWRKRLERRLFIFGVEQTRIRCVFFCHCD
jgi:hypothetical protein